MLRRSCALGSVFSTYVASSGALWKLEDTDDDGRADKRTELVNKFGFTGNAADVHGPFLGPEVFRAHLEGATLKAHEI